MSTKSESDDLSVEEEQKKLNNEILVKCEQIKKMHNEIAQLREQVIQAPSKNAIKFVSSLIKVDHFVEHRRGLICQIIQTLVSQKIRNVKIQLTENNILVDWNDKTKYRQYVYTMFQGYGDFNSYVDLKYDSPEYKFSNAFLGHRDPQYGLFKCFDGTNIKITNTTVGLHFDATSSPCGYDNFFKIRLTKYKEF